jgi:hypothetical protein
MNGELIATLTAEHERLARELHGVHKALKALHQYNDGAPRKHRTMSAASRKKISAA